MMHIVGRLTTFTPFLLSPEFFTLSIAQGAATMYFFMEGTKITIVETTRPSRL